MKPVFNIVFSLLTLLLLTQLPSCKHQPDVLINPDPTDTTGNGGGNGGGNNGTDCDPNVVYFQQQVLPILISNCAMSGCHDPVTKAEGIVLNTYAAVMASKSVKAGKPFDSDLYESITDNDPDDRMPLGRAPLTAAQIEIIRKWIEQGAKDLSCTPGNCDTTAVTWSKTIQPLLAANCQGCHSGGAPAGGIPLTNYTQVKAIAANGKLTGSVSYAPGFVGMPQGTRLSDCNVQLIKTWVNAGAPQN